MRKKYVKTCKKLNKNIITKHIYTYTFKNLYKLLKTKRKQKKKTYLFIYKNDANIYYTYKQNIK